MMIFDYQLLLKCGWGASLSEFANSIYKGILWWKTINACTNRWEVSILVGCVGHLDLIALGGEVAVPALYHLAVITKLEKEKRS